MEYIPHLINVCFGDSGERSNMVVQQGDYNSRKIVCKLWQKLINGRREPLVTQGLTFTVRYKNATKVFAEYETEISDECEITFVLPKEVLQKDGKAELQVLAYSDSGLMSSATIPFKILPSIDASDEVVDSVEPIILRILSQVNEALEVAKEGEEARNEAEQKRTAEFEAWVEKLENLKVEQVFNAPTVFDFPQVGSVDIIYKAQDERAMYQWNPSDETYELLDGATAIVAEDAKTAERLKTPRLISIAGGATGRVAFDGSEDVEIEAVLNVEALTNLELEEMLK